jgi:large subunit ribosomal protein L29
MKAAKWRDLSDEEMTQKVRELSEEVFNLRFQLTMGVAKNPSRIGEARRDLARAYTIIRERGGAPAAVAAAVAPAAVEPAAVATPVPGKPAAKKPRARTAAKAKKPAAAKSTKKSTKKTKKAKG